MSPALLAVTGEGHEAGVALPLEPIWFGVIAFCAFMGLLALLWSFRNTLALDPVAHHHDDLGDGTGTATGSATSPH